MQARAEDRGAKAWQDVAVPPGMGLDCGHYKWSQTQTHVEVAVRIPPNVPSSQVGALSLYVSSSHAPA